MDVGYLESYQIISYKSMLVIVVIVRILHWDMLNCLVNRS